MKVKARLPTIDDQRRGRQRRRGWLQRDQHAAKADKDRRPASPADVLPEKKRRQRRDIDRRGQPIGHRIGERQVNHGEVRA